MSHTEHDRIQRVFLAAVALADAERTAYLDEACAGDATLRAAVERLLTHDERPHTGLDDPAIGRQLRAALTPTVDSSGSPLPRERTIPDQIGLYRILRVIGEGGMGIVYEAQQETPRRRVALKVVNAGVVSLGMLRRFEHEAEVLGRLQHPGIAQIFEAGSIDEGRGGQPFFAMEFIDGQPITEYARTNDLGTRARLELLAKIADAVQHAHQRGIIHRDLKPGNILVDQAGQPKILDFGVARATDADIQTTTLRTNVGQLVGTIPYMSPEQAAGDPSELDTRSDVYALGVIAYELLTGRLPYDLRNKMVHEAVRVIREEEPASLSTIDRLLAGDVETIVGTALEKDKDRRYQSASALAADIRRHLHDEPISARPASAWYQFQKYARRNRTVVSAAALITFVLLVATIVSATFAIAAKRDRDRALQLQAAEAEQRALAERRFTEVQDLANTFLFEIDEEIRHLPGATKAREKLVSTGLAYLDSLAEDASDDPTLLAQLAGASARIADIQGNPTIANLGDPTAALRSYQRSLDLWAQVARVAEDPVPARQAEAALYKRLGEVYSALGSSTESLQSYRKSLDILEELAEARPADFETRRAAGVAHSMIGNAHMQRGERDEALVSFQRGLDTARRILPLSPTSLRLQRDVSISLTEVGSVLEVQGRAEEALALYQEARAIREVHMAQLPNNSRTRRDLSIAIGRVGNAYVKLGRYEDALAEYEAAAALRQPNYDADPIDSRAAADLAHAYEKIGDAHAWLDQDEQALAAFAKSAELRRANYERNSESRRACLELAFSLERMAAMQRRLDRDADALPNLEAAVDLVAPVAREDPDDLLVNNLLTGSLSLLGAIYVKTAESGDRPAADRRAAWATAREYSRRALAQAEHVESKGMPVRNDTEKKATIQAQLDRCEAALEEGAETDVDAATIAQ